MIFYNSKSVPHFRLHLRDSRPDLVYSFFCFFCSIENEKSFCWKGKLFLLSFFYLPLGCLSVSFGSQSRGQFHQPKVSYFMMIVLVLISTQKSPEASYNVGFQRLAEYPLEFESGSSRFDFKPTKPFSLRIRNSWLVQRMFMKTEVKPLYRPFRKRQTFVRFLVLPRRRDIFYMNSHFI